MGNFFGNIKNGMTKFLKKVSKTIVKTVLPIALIVLIPLLILSGLIQEITRQDAEYSEGDSANVPYASTEYTSNVTINEDGKITTAITAKELWDKLIKNNSRVTEYLNKPEELLKLMNAEIVTNYPDTRSNPDEKIDWETLNKNIDSKETQGIIKFKRSKEDGSNVTMTYVDSETFYAWIEYYNLTGDEATKQNILNHFTIERKTNTNANTNIVQLDYNGKDIITDISEAILKAAQETDPAGPGLCQAWVRRVYKNAGLPDVGYIGAYQAFQETCISTDLNNIPIGAAVYGTGSATINGGPNIYGHVGIYVGDIDGDGKGDVMDNVTGSDGNGVISTQSLESWIQWQVNAGNTACGGTPGWLGWGWQSGSPTKILSGGKENGNTDNNTSSAQTENNSQVLNTLDNILFIGDSITVGLDDSGLIPNAIFYAKESTSPSYWLERIGTLPENGDNIRGVCVMLGVNRTDQIAEMKELIDELAKKYDGKTIFIQKVLPVANTYTNYETMNANIKNFNDEISEYCKGKANLKFIDTSEGYVDSSGAAKAELFDNAGLHPTNYQILKDNIEKKITNQAVENTTSNYITNKESNSSQYYVIVGRWKEKFEEKVAVGEQDPEESYIEANTLYNMSTQKIDYQNMVKGYTMPFDYLWAILVTGRNRDFALDLADLVYNSEIEITIHDSVQQIKDVDTYKYTRKTKVNTFNISTSIVYSNSLPNDPTPEEHIAEEGWMEGDTKETIKNYTTKHTVDTKINTLDVSLTKANVWIVNYNRDYTYSPSSENKADPVTNDLETIDYPDSPDEITNSDPASIASNYAKRIRSKYSVRYRQASILNIMSTSEIYYAFEGTVTNENTVTTSKYTSSPPVIKEKTDKYSNEDNFVNLFLRNYEAKTNILSAPSWLFEILESSEKTVEMVDLTKYLLYKATNYSYRVTDYDFSTLNQENFVSIGGDYGTSSGIEGVQGQIYNFFLSKGIPAPGVAAIMGNIQAESSFVPDATNSTHNGLCQWDKNDRFLRLVELANSKGTDWTDVQTQIEFIWQELEKNYSKVKEVLINATEEDDIEYATWYFGRYYEVFFANSNNFEESKGMTATRYKYANNWYQKWKENNSKETKQEESRE